MQEANEELSEPTAQAVFQVQVQIRLSTQVVNVPENDIAKDAQLQESYAAQVQNIWYYFHGNLLCNVPRNCNDWICRSSILVVM